MFWGTCKGLFLGEYKHHRRYRGRFHHSAAGRCVATEKSLSLKEATGGDRCPLCKNHCSLSAPQCERGREYASKSG